MNQPSNQYKALAEDATLEAAVVHTMTELENASLSFGHGTEDAEEEAYWLVLKACDEPLGQENYGWDQTLTVEKIAAVNQLANARIVTRKPLAYLLNEAWFAGYSFHVDERVLVPRSFFAEWVDDQFEPWIDPQNVHSILDLCCGSGCIGIATAHAFTNASVVMSDYSADALAVAKTNITRHNLEDRVRLNHGAMFEGVDQKFDLILCNPPYVSTERMDKLPQEYLAEPDIALRAGEDGLDFIRPMLLQAPDYLTPDGVLMVEAGSAALSMDAVWPDVPFTWLGTAHDEMVLFMMTRDQLKTYQSTFKNS